MRRPAACGHESEAHCGVPCAYHILYSMTLMRKSGIALAGVAAAALVAGMTLGALPAKAASAPPWHVSYRSYSTTQSVLTAVSADSKTDAWAGGTIGTGAKTHSLVMHWANGKWTTVSTSKFPSFSPVTVKATAPNNVWFFGWDKSGPRALVYNGSALTAKTLPYGFDVGDVAVLGSKDVWAVGGNTCDSSDLSTCATTLWHWNGATWLSTSVAGLVNQVTTNRSHVWFLGLTKINTSNYNNGTPSGQPVLYEPTNGVLRKVSAPTTRIMDTESVAAAPNGQLWIFADIEPGKHPAALLHWTGGRWTQASVPANVCPPGLSGYCPMEYVPPVAFDGRSGVWVGPSAHWTGSAWANTSISPYITSVIGNLEALLPLGFTPIPGTGSIWMVGAVNPKPNSNVWDAVILAYGTIP